LRDIFLETERVFLRCFGPQDAALLTELDSDPEVMRFISKGQPTTLEHNQGVLLPRLLSYQRSSPPSGFWAAHLRVDDSFAGWFHLRPDKIDPDQMELGYRLKRAVWNRGLATEVSRVIVSRAFSDWGYRKISARTLVNHIASRRVMEKSGLHFEREFIWDANIFPGWSEEERRGVKYSLERASGLGRVGVS
jgi:RimJ/RimL family protein N-acetyltransferase